MTDEKLKIINHYKNRIKILKEHNHYYYNEDSPKISDFNYDEIKKEITLLEKKYDHLKKLNLLSDIIGAKPTNKFQKKNHLIPMLSLSNAFEKSDMKDFIKKVNIDVKSTKFNILGINNPLGCTRKSREYYQSIIYNPK